MTYGRPTAAELVTAVAEFLDSDVRDAADLSGQVKFHARVASNVLRIVQRELDDNSSGDVLAALEQLGYSDEAVMAADIRAGALDGRDTDVMACLRVIVGHRLRVAHPGYQGA